MGLRVRRYLGESLSSKERKALEKKLWARTHKDYRSMWGGEKHILVFSGKGTTMKALSSLSDEELKKRAR